MNNYYQQTQYPYHTTYTNNSPIFEQAWRMGVTGAVIGGASATTRSILKYRADKREASEIARNTAREAASTGAASMVGSIAVSTTKTSGLLATVLFVSATIGAKFLIDGIVSKKITE